MKQQLAGVKQNIAEAGKMEQGSQMPMQDKLLRVIDFFLKLMHSYNGPKLKATKPAVLGLGEPESDYDW